MATHPSTVIIKKEKMIEGPKDQKPNKLVFDTKQQKPVQECGSKKTKNVVGIKEEKPFVEEPVCFDFGNDYGNNLFIDLEKELDYVRSQGIMVKATNHADDYVYELSSVEDMISTFHKEAL